MGCSHVHALARSQRPPPGKEAMLFGSLDKLNVDVSEWQELVVCPSRQGSHICFTKSFDILFKVKVQVTHSEHAPRYNVYNVNNNGKTANIECGHVEKGRTSFQAAKGWFKMEQCWHVGVFKLELKPRKGVLHPKKARMLSTPIEAWSVNVKFITEAQRDFRRKQEAWTWSCECDSPTLKMQVDLPPGRDSANSVDSLQVMRVFENGKIACVGRRQNFEHTALRGAHERPFLGIRLKASEENLRAGMQSKVVVDGGPAVKSDAEDKKKKLQRANSSLAPSASFRSQYHPPGVGPEVLPLFMTLAWCEEAMHPPEDLREYFIKRMRSKSSKTASWNSDEGQETAKGASALSVQTADSEMPSDQDILDMMQNLSKDQEHQEKSWNLSAGGNQV